jgi:hypothetical protein
MSLVAQQLETHKRLQAARQELWRLYLPNFLCPYREFVLDPSLQFWTIVVTLALPKRWDFSISRISQTLFIRPTLATLRFFSKDPDGEDLLVTAGKELLHPVAPRPLHFQPPSDIQSALSGVAAFVLSVVADVIGAFMDPVKMKKWFSAMSAFRAYLQASGVGAELEESLIKPLWRGRLLDNLKILNDCQEILDEDRTKLANDLDLEVSSEDLVVGCSMMRFATAAYGVEMVRSAIDREANYEHVNSERKAIAFHCNIPTEDVKYIYIQPGDEMHTMRHFIAVDEKTKSVVLAIRGTLSISGALADMQAMDFDFCGGKAHMGIAEQANLLWQKTGQRLRRIASAYSEQYRIIFTGHSLGGGAACLLHVKVHTENLLPTRQVYCYGFAPPPTYCKGSTPSPGLEMAVKNCVCFVHDNDCVPLLSVASIRRLACLMDAVDNCTENLWFTTRFRIFWEFVKVPGDIVKTVCSVKHDSKAVVGESAMVIPARCIVWMKKTLSGRFEALACSSKAMASMNIFVCQDMIADHMPEQYEDALDSLVARRFQEQL